VIEIAAAADGIDIKKISSPEPFIDKNSLASAGLFFLLFRIWRDVCEVGKAG
jgi:hypothetical protein